MNQKTIDSWRRKISENEARAAEWQRKIDDNQDASSHQLGVWRGRVNDYNRRAKAYRERIEYYSK